MDAAQVARAALSDFSEADTVVPGRGGSALRNFLPGLWSATPRVLVVGEQRAVLLGPSGGISGEPKELCRGDSADIRTRSLAGRLLRVRLPGGGRLQVDGKRDVARLLAALRT